MSNLKKLAIGALTVTFLLSVFMILYLQIFGKSNDFGSQIMPVAAVGNKDGVFVIGNLYDEYTGELLTSGIYSLDKDNFKLSLYNTFILDAPISFEKIEMDNAGNIFVIVRTGYEITTYEIWKITEGNITDRYDISDIIDEENCAGIRAFAVDGNGAFYIRERLSDEMIVINGEKQVVRVKDIANDIFFESMTAGKDGQIYALFCQSLNAGGGYKIASFSDGISYEVCSGTFLPYEEIYSVMGVSTEYDLVLKGVYGIYGYDLNMVAAESISYFSPYDAEYTKSFFVDDELFVFFIDVNDNNRHIVESIEAKVIDLLTGDVRYSQEVIPLN